MLIDKFTFQTDFLFYKKHTKCTLNLRSLDFPSADSSREENNTSESLKVLLRAPNPVALSYIDKSSCAYNLAPR